MTTFHNSRIPASRHMTQDQLEYEAFMRGLHVTYTDTHAYITKAGVTYCAERGTEVAA